MSPYLDPQKLMEAKRFDDAASAYKKVLEKEPGNRNAKTGVAIALAKARNEEVDLPTFGGRFKGQHNGCPKEQPWAGADIRGS
jgi:hypothetical protein